MLGFGGWGAGKWRKFLWRLGFGGLLAVQALASGRPQTGKPTSKPTLAAATPPSLPPKGPGTPKADSADAGFEAWLKAMRASAAQPKPRQPAPLELGTPRSERVTVASKAVGRYRLHPGAKLRHAVLRGADLRNCDLTGADLTGADLTGALLGGAIFTDAILDNTCLYGADTAGAVGLTWKGVVIHPFFEVAADEKVGTVKFLTELNGGRFRHEPVFQLVQHPDGRLSWTNGVTANIRVLLPTGAIAQISAVGDRELYAHILDAKGRLWTFGDRLFGTWLAEDLGAVAVGEAVGFMNLKAVFQTPPHHVVADGLGDIWVSLADRSLRFSFDGKGFDINTSTPSSASRNRDMPNRDATLICTFDPESSGLRCSDGDWRLLAHFTLPDGGRPVRFALGQGTDLWFTQKDPDAIGRITLEPGSSKPVLEIRPLSTPGAPTADPCGIALGPDGQIWCTEKTGDQIVRLNPDDSQTRFPLPPGTRPLELIAGTDGRLYFTREGCNSIGAIRAEPRPATRSRAEAAVAQAPGAAVPAASKDRPGAETAASWAEPAYAPRPERRKPLTQQERWQRHEELMARAEQRFADRLALEAKTGQPAPAQAPETKAETGVELAAELAKTETRVEPAAELAKGAPAAEASPSLGDRLEALGINLSRGALRHILRQHGHGRVAAKGQFSAALSTPAELAALLVQGLEEAGEIARIQSYNPLGEKRYLTLCRRPEVGCTPHAEARLATSRFVVVTAKVGGDHDVITAYPVVERR